jgi:hypothetical protein
MLSDDQSRQAQVAPEGWKPPPIFPSLRNPILLRQRGEGIVATQERCEGGSSAPSQPENARKVDDPVVTLPAHLYFGGSHHYGDEGYDTDDDMSMLESAECSTPPYTLVPSQELLPVQVGVGG